MGLSGANGAGGQKIRPGLRGQASGRGSGFAHHHHGDDGDRPAQKIRPGIVAHHEVTTDHGTGHQDSPGFHRGRVAVLTLGTQGTGGGDGLRVNGGSNGAGGGGQDSGTRAGITTGPAGNRTRPFRRSPRSPPGPLGTAPAPRPADPHEHPHRRSSGTPGALKSSWAGDPPRGRWGRSVHKVWTNQNQGGVVSHRAIGTRGTKANPGRGDGTSRHQGLFGGQVGKGEVRAVPSGSWPLLFPVRRKEPRSASRGRRGAKRPRFAVRVANTVRKRFPRNKKGTRNCFPSPYFYCGSGGRI